MLYYGKNGIYSDRLNYNKKLNLGGKQYEDMETWTERRGNS